MMSTMIASPFLTDIDPQAAIKGSRDPLGIQPIWTRRRRKPDNCQQLCSGFRPWFIYCLQSKLESSRMAPKEKQQIEIEKTHRGPLLSFNQAVTVDCSDFLGTALELDQQFDPHCHYQHPS